MKEVFCFLLLLALVNPGFSAEETAKQPTAGPVVELPPLMVESKDATMPWLYSTMEDIEMLARCDTETARNMLQNMVRVRHSLHRILPESLTVRNDQPHAVILYSQALKPQMPHELMEEMRRKSNERQENSPMPRVSTLPNLNLPDVDNLCSFIFIRERHSMDELSFAAGFVRLLMERRTPQLPTWFIEGFSRFYQEAKFNGNTMYLGRLSWSSVGETEALRRDSRAPRVFLPMDKLFVTGDNIPNGEANAFRGLWLDELALFVRWALTGDQERKKGFWELVSRSCNEPVTEELLLSCLGVGYAGLQDRLSDFLPGALIAGEHLVLDAGKVDRPKMREATEPEIVRLKAEWERLQLSFVRARAPQMAERYEEQVRRTLRRVAYDSSIEPRILATRALLECDVGNFSEAFPLLERIAETPTPRVKAVYELARQRFVQAKQKPEGAGGLLSQSQTETILGPLRKLRAMHPRIVEAGLLECMTWLLSEGRPAAGDMDSIKEYLWLYPKQGSLCLLGSCLLVKEGRREKGLSEVQIGLLNCESSKVRSRLLEWRNYLLGAKSGAFEAKDIKMEDQ